MDAKKDLLFVGVKDSPLVIRDKPNITRVERSSGKWLFFTSDQPVFDRLNAFLPQIKQANQQLEEDLKNDNEDKYNIEAVDEDQPYIEMNLGIPKSEDSDENEDSEEIEDVDEGKDKEGKKRKRKEGDADEEDKLSDLVLPGEDRYQKKSKIVEMSDMVVTEEKKDNTM